MMIYVSKKVWINEFIIMIKNRFFNNTENVNLEDIWLYRIEEQYDESNKFQSFNKIEYDIKKYFDCPLFNT